LAKVESGAGHRVLTIYMEPAPYIVGLLKEVRLIWAGEIETLFAHGALSQPWGYQVGGASERTLPSSPLEALACIRRLLANNRYSLVHLAGWGGPVLSGTLLLAALSGIPVSVETDTQFAANDPAWKRLAKAIIYRPMFRLPAVFLPGGRRQAAYLHRYGVEERRIQIARMTVDVEKMLAYSGSIQPETKSAILRRYGIPEQGAKILFVGRLEPHKGLVDLVEAFDRLRVENRAVSLIIAGDGSLSDWARHQASPERSIYYLGRLAGEQVWDAYEISDIFVLPSHFEPWGLVVNEAMAFGLPVIASDRVGCVDDLVQQNRSGFVVPAGSPDELRSALELLVTNPDMRKRMGIEGRRVIADWTLENWARATVNAWRRNLQCAA
jgi:glycosyltransferase involved in cell wall biosynthesis